MIGTLIILLLILVNGVFAMSEIALVSAKRMRLQQQADQGDKAAAAALLLVDNPSRSLSTIQIGITLIGIFMGAFGEASIVSRLTPLFEDIGLSAQTAKAIAMFLVVVGITFFSLIFGELVPKRVAMNHAEKIATVVARPMTLLSKAMAPFVWILTVVTDLVLKLLRVDSKGDELTEEDISGILREGATAGLFEKTEHDIVTRALSLDDQSVLTIMTPRNDVHYIDLESPLNEILLYIADSNYSRFPVCDGGLDNVLGVIDAGTLFEQQIRGHAIDISALVKPARFVPETNSAMDVLESFEEYRTEMVIVINEYGEVEGLVTLRDVLKVLVGYKIPLNDNYDADIVQRNDGSWLIDGAVTLDRFNHHFQVQLEFPDHEDNYHTLAGFILNQLGHIPKETESLVWEGFYFEVVDMDKYRIDRLLVKAPEQVVALSDEE
ncbi:Putative Mg2+ and Co2+ transporter CorB [Oligella urethralis]|uniref:hemolysin family protein n=1 Tax=Oligella urethralis TaxID=90245 RepID=UPI000E03D698|nr:hemolysin family protein [Oligella urethralis]SUA64238.1 Putative Mg2+ and Co2+ transporter CorB [Oligella urethralis]